MTALFALLLCAPGAPGPDPDARLVVRVDRPGAAVSPLLYGVFFEEINRAGEGGLFAEMVQNRSFEDSLDKINAWTLVKDDAVKGAMALDASRPMNARNVHALRLELGGPGRVGAANEGFNGVSVEAGKPYRFTLYARGSHGFTGAIAVALESAEGKVIAKADTGGVGTDWTKHDGVLKSMATDPKARLVVSIDAPGTVWVDQVSLMPGDASDARPFRADLLEKLRAMRPAFVRFPGGCYVEGNRLQNAFRWKDSIGDPAQRPGHWNLWGYRSSDGLGYLEYLELCEELDAEPMHVINCGMAHEDHATPERLAEFIQDALDSIEYANGDPKTTTWGKLRASHGRERPFKLRLLEIGNENGGPVYEAAYAAFHDAIRAKYPDIQLIANVPVRSRTPDIVDEHYYNSPTFFLRNSGRYDAYDRTGPKIYVGEYAVTQGSGQGNLIAALGEAAFMTGMERNGDQVVMTSYAPLFVNAGWRQWNPDAIVFDASRSFGTPSYHVQAMFGANRADTVLPVEVQAPSASQAVASGRIGIGTWNTQAEFKDISFTDENGKTLFQFDPEKGLKPWTTRGGNWEVADGVVRQTSDATPALAFAGDSSWTTGSLRLKARKTGGAEGFLISFQSDRPGRKNWWNLGGWGNQRHGLEHDNLPGDDRPGRIETGRWYDVAIEITAAGVTCSLDGKVVHDVKTAPIQGLYAVAGLDAKTKEIILKVVNPTGSARLASITLEGAPALAPTGTAITLSGPGPLAENSFETPEAIAPIKSEVGGVGPKFTHAFPAWSVSVLRLPPAL
jgi:alpha-L-arabinofuranosidase